MMTERVAMAEVADDGTAGSPPARREGPDASPRVVTSESLLAGTAQLAILHNQTIYFLRQTRFGKLILTK